MHQVMTRIFRIFLTEILGFDNVQIIPLEFENPNNLVNSLDTLDSVYNYKNYNISMINLHVWMTVNVFSAHMENVYIAGSSIMPGRFGWFVPRSLVAEDEKSYSLDYEIFKSLNSTYYELYVLEDHIEQMLRRKSVEQYMNPKCVNRTCATILAEHRNDTDFIKYELETIYLNVYWLGDKLRDTIKQLPEQLSAGKRFLVLHWVTSELIDEKNYTQIKMPRCEELEYLQKTNCRYEFTPILKSHAQRSFENKRLMYALRRFKLEDAAVEYIRANLGKLREQGIASTHLYNKVACNWLKSTQKYQSWLSKGKIPLTIGGIFPMSDTRRGHQNITGAALQAVRAINNNATILPNYKLTLKINDGECKSAMVMKAFIHYFYAEHDMLGVLGPACSETVEPIAGISKHMNMLVMSYSAEGASYVDRSAYPYFFRTIGSNIEYVDAYVKIMQQLGWNRVSILTEDGHQYAEYMTHMDNKLRLHNFTLSFNRKLESDISAEDMREHLLKLKEAQSRIIIADLRMENAAVALCEAIKMGMTQRDEYIWFLPTWLSKDFVLWNRTVNGRCTISEFRQAIEGHFSIRHTPFGAPDGQMQEEKTRQAWLDEYGREYKNYSSYVGFVYDAVWAYGLAAHKLLQADKHAVNHLRSKETVSQLTKLLWETDFVGLSGRVKFGQGEFGGSRIIDLDVLQWRNASYVLVGKFQPQVEGNASTLRLSGGHLDFNRNAVYWVNGKEPEDGRYDCRFSYLARSLRLSCAVAEIVFIVLMCLATVAFMTLISFYFWKQRYNRKVQHSAEIMKMFGIDLITPSRNKVNTLDKWEIAKENVVVNRRLGEGAFGTVYGGEACLGSGDWTAVAVKTLKSGASTEDRLDFLAEAEAMKKFEHKNIVQLLAVCLQSEPIYTIMEFMLYGDLKTYLLARRNMVNEKTGDESDISAKRLTMYALDVAQGLAYLAEQKYVHRDIACRNCLVNSQRVVKIGDFGMARPTFESDYYCFNRKGVRKLFPVRWMPPETLSLGLFTPSSDIWSFGVVLFEVITFGSYPYQGLTNNQVLDFVKAGNTLQIPPGVKPQLEALLRSCWSQDASKRPTALEVIDYIVKYPRLLTPTIDCPATAVQLPEIESDEMELLPPGRARKGTPLNQGSSLDLLQPSKSGNSLQQLNFNQSDENSYDKLANADSGTDCMQLCSSGSFSATTPDGYSIMSPLLKHQTHAKSDTKPKLLP
ncbi:LOW QUALITY PROTEIN: retinal guanylyl cyclase 2 [Drosophila busckii]|uniref:LOW QUALITY PROTEIN: retinal guanylyl cyclase 2 n=1 Tax=Drosophila busckii TaxID=30019 RepID=UPI001432F020|nr:LOW QUALITY PROTEIN: retinal guanylyl cyclase 2 [Drosophila busckii]